MLHRPSSGSFVSYAREFFGEKAAFAAGWMYFLNWAMTSIVDTTAIATISTTGRPSGRSRSGCSRSSRWWSCCRVNMISVKWFGELEFWAALIKVVALVTFLVVGTGVPGRPIQDRRARAPESSIVVQHGGLFPTGVLPLVIVTSGVVFAYAGVELVGTAAGETEDPEKIMPRAINSVIARIAVFYVGSVVLLSLLLPYTAFKAGASPFVTFFSKIGFGGAGDS